MAVGVSGVIQHKLYNDYYISKHGYSYVDVYYEEEYDVATNSSVIKIPKITFAHSKYGGSWWVFGSVTIDGIEYGFNVENLSSGGTITNPITSHPIYHDGVTGEKTITISTACNTHGGSGGTQFYAGNHGTATVTVPLTTLPRTSSVTVADGVMGEPVAITIGRGSDVFTHTLRYSFGEATGVIAEQIGETSLSWIPPMELCSQIPNATSGVCAITCETYNSAEYIGKTVVAVYLSVPDTVGLRLQDGWATALPYNQATVAAELDAFVQGYSKARVLFDASRISAADAYGASVASFDVIHNGSVIAEPCVTPVLQTAGETELLCRVTDTRGRVLSQALRIGVEAYAKPTIRDIAVFRCESNGTENDEGTYVSVTATGGFSSIGGLNHVVLHAEVGAAVSREIPNSTTTVLGDGAILNTATYPVTLTATDRLGNKATYTQLLPTAEVMFHGRKGGKGAAFGKYGEADDLLDVDWNLRVRKDVTVYGDAAVDGALTVGGKTLSEIVLSAKNPLETMPIGYIYISTDITSPASMFGGTWERITARFLYGVNDGYAGVTAGEEYHTLTVNEMPSHCHGYHPRINWVDDYSGQVYSSWANDHIKIDGHTLYTDYTGGGAAHNNMPPWYGVYMWRRVE